MTFEGGRGMSDFREKYNTDWFRGEEISCKEMPGEKYSCTEKKYLSWRITLEKISHRCMSGKHSITRGLRKKNYCTNQITHTPTPHSPSKFKWYSGIWFRLHVAQEEDKRKQGSEPKLAICNIQYLHKTLYHPSTRN